MQEAQSPPAPANARTVGPFSVTEHGTFKEPWAAAFAPGTKMLFVTQKAGAITIVDTPTGQTGTVSGVPTVDYGGQGGLGDIAFLPSQANAKLDRRTVYLSWAEAGQGDTRGAVVGRGTLVCAAANACRIEQMSVIWRQAPKVTGRGHYSHRITFSPDEKYLYIASGERQKGEPAQDRSNNLGTIVRLTLDGKPAAGNPFINEGGITSQIWSYGHRNILGLKFDAEGRLWDLEHGPAGGDELNLVKAGANYGWPVVSDGDHYDGKRIPDNDTRPDLAAPVFGWTPVIAPGDFIFHSGNMFGKWRGDALIAGLKTKAIIHLKMGGAAPVEVGRYDMGERIREIVEGPDGAIWLLEDGEKARLLRLTPS